MKPVEIQHYKLTAYDLNTGTPTYAKADIEKMNSVSVEEALDFIMKIRSSDWEIIKKLDEIIELLRSKQGDLPDDFILIPSRRKGHWIYEGAGYCHCSVCETS